MDDDATDAAKLDRTGTLSVRDRWARRLSIILPLLIPAVATAWYLFLAATSPGPYNALVFLVIAVYGVPVVLVLAVIMHLLVGLGPWCTAPTKRFVSWALGILLYLPVLLLVGLYLLMW